jgi:hypothetical protein
MKFALVKYFAGFNHDAIIYSSFREWSIKRNAPKAEIEDPT